MASSHTPKKFNARVHLKSCKRCKGDLLLSSDVYGSFLHCLQCGADYNISEEDLIRAERESLQHLQLRLSMFNKPGIA